MGNRLYIGNLSYQTSTEELRAEFESCGKVVDAKVVTDRETGVSRGFGFVQFATDAEAEAAVQSYDGTDFGGRQLRVRIAEDRPRQGGAPNDGPRNFSPRPSGGRPQSFGSPSPMPDYSEGPKGGKKRRGGGGRRRQDDDTDWG